MIKIIVPATSANLGPGFDVMGVALSLYNTFYFERNEEFVIEDKNADIFNIKDNLIIMAYLRAFEIAKRNIVTVKLRIESFIPLGKGLGSSATCIVAGVMAANYYMDNILTTNEILNIINMIEGHPDNVAPALLGGLVASVVNEDVIPIKYDVCQKLKFHALVPNYKISTKESRKALPTTLPYSDIVYNLSRIVNLPYAFKTGDLNLLMNFMSDKMHQPYRLGFISQYTAIYKYAKERGYPLCLSGSGPTLLMIAKDDISLELGQIVDWNVYCLSVDINGAQLFEL